MAGDKGLKIGRNVSVPDTMVTETIAYLAKRGMGKSNAAVVTAEEMYDLGYQWVAIDPKGDWWGIRSNAAGTGPGLPVPVFGGRHADLPLEPTSGALMAGLVVERNLTCVLDVSLFSKAEQIRFVTDFAETLFRDLGDDPRPMHLFLEEAEEFLPQRVDARSARMVGAYSKISKQGRTLGLGVSLITQRSASINKDALSQTDTLILFRTTSPHDRKAVTAWAEHHGEEKHVAESLSSLQPGQSWILSPGFLGSIERVDWRRRRTFDSGATPAARKASTRKKPVTLADIDLDEIRVRMAETIEAAEAKDPKALRRKVAELERQLATARDEGYKHGLADAEPVDPEPVEVPVLDAAAARAIVRAADSLGTMQIAIADLLAEVEPILAEVHEADFAGIATEPTTITASGGMIPTATSFPDHPAIGRPAADAEKVQRTPTAPVRYGDPTAPSDVDMSGITGGALRILGALSRFPAGMTEAQTATQARLKKTGGTFGTYVSRLTTRGLVERLPDRTLRITATGMRMIGATGIEEVTGEALRAEWRSRFTGGARRMFDVLVEAYPSGFEKDALAASAGLSQAGGTFGTYLSRLRTNGLLIEEDGLISASEDLFR